MTFSPHNLGEALSRRNLLLTSSAFATAVALPSKVAHAQVDQAQEEVLRLTIQAIEAMPVGPLPTGAGINEILQYGQLEELGTTFDRRDLGLAYLYSGLAVLARNTFFYLESNPRDDAKPFLELVNEVYSEEELRYEERSFPYYSGQSGVDQLPNTLQGVDERGYADVSKLSGPYLGEPEIIHEWTFKPGKRFYKKVIGKSRDTICKEGGPYEAFQRGDRLMGQSDLPFVIAQTVLVSAFAPGAFWCPLAVYCGLLILKTGLKTYCED